MQQYQYDGPVMRFDDCIQHRWKATTVAPTEAKAKSIVVLSATFNRVSRFIFFPIAENNYALFSLYCHLTWMILLFSISSAFPP